MSGVPPSALDRYRQERTDKPETEIDAIRAPDRSLVGGVEVETDLGAWQVYETPGHAPSHVCFHQPERKLLISGDHLLGRTVLVFDHGHTPDCYGEFISSLEVIEPLEVDLCLAGHGKPFRDPAVKITDVRRRAADLLQRVRQGLAGGAEPTAFELVEEIAGTPNVTPGSGTLLLQAVLACLDHLAVRGEASPVPDSEPQRWRA
jgi:glyoxylase-like metal-dependent hydrolase (beta-lactamase superfamily II)